jgi:hypothetical protein
MAALAVIASEAKQSSCTPAGVLKNANAAAAASSAIL